MVLDHWLVLWVKHCLGQVCGCLEVLHVGWVIQIMIEYL